LRSDAGFIPIVGILIDRNHTTESGFRVYHEVEVIRSTTQGNLKKSFFCYLQRLQMHVPIGQSANEG